ncbi:Uncharacterised protein [Mycobacterium tuberculosis]|nr:Uncharacterised protein [Mycobacterium tuberculosis]
MPGRFREGTETCIRKVRTLETLPTCRQTQNPERGRKHFERELVHSPPFRSSDPKPREGTETRKRSTSLTILFSRRQTQNPERGRKRPVDGGCVVRASVVRPKTPRGDGNSITLFLSVARLRVSSDPKPREGTETRNPAPHPQLRHAPEVVRPKTPRGDGNPHGGTWTSATIGVVGPKTPRGDGNWTQNRTGCGRCSSRQTQNPERGRKPDDGQ